MIKYFDRFNKYYNNMKEPYRFLMAMLIMHPFILASILPYLYLIIVAPITMAFIGYRLAKSN